MIKQNFIRCPRCELRNGSILEELKENRAFGINKNFTKPFEREIETKYGVNHKELHRISIGGTIEPRGEITSEGKLLIRVNSSNWVEVTGNDFTLNCNHFMCDEPIYKRKGETDGTLSNQRGTWIHWESVVTISGTGLPGTVVA